MAATELDASKLKIAEAEHAQQELRCEAQKEVERVQELMMFAKADEIQMRQAALSAEETAQSIWEELQPLGRDRIELEAQLATSK